MKRIILSAILGLAVGSYVATPLASATPTLSLFDGTTIVTITDGSGSDLNGATGAVTFSGSIGTWTVNVTTGITAPVLGTLANPHMDLSSVNVSSGGGGTLTIRFSEVGYTNPSLGPFNLKIGGTVDDTTGSSLVYSGYSGSTLFQQGTLLASLGPFGSGAFSNAASGSVSGVGPFSLTQVVTITHPAGAGQSTSFNAELTSVPEPASMVLLGSGLLALGAWARKRTQA